MKFDNTLYAFSEFYDYFTILGGEINPVINENDRVKNLNNYAIYINPEDIVKMEEQDYDSFNYRAFIK